MKKGLSWNKIEEGFFTGLGGNLDYFQNRYKTFLFDKSTK